MKFLLGELFLLIKGVVIGVANVIPGISGGTLAVVLGLYERLTDSIGNFFTNLRDGAATRARLAFLIPVFLGAAIGVVEFSAFLGMLYRHGYDGLANLFFIGLIVGSLPALCRYGDLSLRRIRPDIIVGFVIGLVVMGTFVVLQTHVDSSAAALAAPPLSAGYLIKLFLCGLFAAVAMVIPGISGSLLLVMAGEFKHLVLFVNALFHGGAEGGPPLMVAVVALAVTSLGALIGLVFCARFIAWAIRHKRRFTFSIILGIVIMSIPGALRGGTLNSKPVMIALGTVVGAIGFLLAFFVGRAGRRSTKPTT